MSTQPNNPVLINTILALLVTRLPQDSDELNFLVQRYGLDPEFPWWDPYSKWPLSLQHCLWAMSQELPYCLWFSSGKRDSHSIYIYYANQPFTSIPLLAYLYALNISIGDFQDLTNITDEELDRVFKGLRPEVLYQGPFGEGQSHEDAQRLRELALEYLKNQVNS